MAWYWQTYTMHLDPWAKIHLGFTRPLVLRHHGTYTLYETEVSRSWSMQQVQPMAVIISDGRRDSGYQECFILENRNQALLPDRGLAVWLIKEDPFNLRKVVRLIRRADHWVNDDVSLWDGVDSTQGYDLTSTSSPRDTAWTDGTPSWIEITDISQAGPAVTFTVRLPSIFVDWANAGFENGRMDYPFNTIPEAITAIDEPPRTVRIAPGSYAAPLTIAKACTLVTWGTGSVVIGP